MSRLVIVGGGVTGLSAAWRARRLAPTAEIVVLERDARFGGKLRTETFDGFTLEAGPDGFLSRKLAALDLCRELGVVELLQGQIDRTTRSFVSRRHVLHPVPEGFSGLVPANLDALRESTLISEAGKRRAAERSSRARASPAVTLPERRSSSASCGKVASRLRRAASAA